MPGARPRQVLFAALADDRHIPLEVLAELADRAGWPLPRRVRAVVLAHPGEAPSPAPRLVPQPAAQLAAALGHGLPGTVEGELCLLIPDPGPRARPALEAALHGRVAAVGHAVPVTDAAASLRWARRLPGLMAAAGGPVERVTFVDDHLSELLLIQDASLARALSARWLRPLEDLTPRQSERLEVTLLAWLESGGAPEAARTLKVHPQTVRYRLRQIEKLFGPAMREPRSRFELELALRSRGCWRGPGSCAHGPRAPRGPWARPSTRWARRAGRGSTACETAWRGGPELGCSGPPLFPARGGQGMGSTGAGGLCGPGRPVSRCGRR
ncbi:PucR family transcriptional regulator [Streptomyces stramineus]